MQHTHSDDTDGGIDDAAYAALVSRIRRLIRIDYSYDIPYTAGISVSGLTVYVDRRLRALDFDGHPVQGDLDAFLVLHEVTEHALMHAMERLIGARFSIGSLSASERSELLQTNYQHCHQLAQIAERAAVETAGLDWNTYDAFWRPLVHRLEQGTTPLRAPPDLWLRPYQDEEDDSILRRLRLAGVEDDT